MKQNNQPILAAVDFSVHSEEALLWAADAARRFEAPLIVLHVVHDPGSAPGSYKREGQLNGTVPQEEVAVEQLEDFLRRVAERDPDLAEPGFLETLLVVGLPATRIVEVAEAEGAQLIVVGSQGRTGLSRVLLGSKAQRVAQLSPVPVTIVKREGQA